MEFQMVKDMTTMVKTVFCGMFIFLLCGCLPVDVHCVYYSMENKCGDTIYVSRHSCKSNEFINVRRAFWESSGIYMLQPGETFMFETGWHEENFTEGRTEQILVFKQSTLKKYTKEVMIRKDTCDKRIVLTYDDLKALDFKIVYDGR